MAQVKYQKAVEALRKFPPVFVDEMKNENRIFLRTVQRVARRIHRFKTRSGNLERSVLIDVSRQKVRGGMRRGLEGGSVYLEQGIAPYGRRIHEGWGRWKPDPFLVKAFIKLRDTEYENRLRGAVRRALRKVFK